MGSGEMLLSQFQLNLGGVLWQRNRRVVGSSSGSSSKQHDDVSSPAVCSSRWCLRWMGLCEKLYTWFDLWQLGQTYLGSKQRCFSCQLDRLCRPWRSLILGIALI
jgi:hypothetical protein